MPDEPIKPRGMMLLPPPEGHCRVCGTMHEPGHAHNATSLFYQARFQMRYGRPGTWADAIAHLPEQQQILWMRCIRQKDNWTEPPEGTSPISEPIDS